jgi:O-antigen/teichoic acid export membrane protein
MKKKLLYSSLIVAVISSIFKVFFIWFSSYFILLEHIGQYSLILSVISIISMLVISPILNTANRKLQQFDNTENNFYEIYGTYLNIATSISCIFVAIIITIVFDLSLLITLGILLYLYFFTWLRFYKSTSQFQLKHRLFIYFIVAENIATVLTPMIFYLYFETFYSLFVGLFFGVFISFIFFRKTFDFVKLHFKLKLVDKKTFLSILKYGVPLILSSIGSLVISFSDRWIISYYGTYEDVGTYTLLAQLSSMLLILGMIMNTYIVPLVFRLTKNSQEEAIGELKKFFLISIGILFVVFLFIYILPISMFSIIFNPKVFEYSNNLGFDIFYILLIGIGILTLINISSNYFMIIERTKYMAYIWSIGALINISINLIFMQYYDTLLVASISTLISYLIILIVPVSKLFKGK